MFTVAITTYRKNQALDVLLTSLKQHFDDSLLGSVVICDDSFPDAWEVFIKHGPAFQGKLVYIGGKNLGIAKNKNRGIKFFLEHTKDEHLLMLDDDIQFIGAGLEHRLLTSRWGHVNGYLGIPGQDPKNLPHFKEFPAYAVDWNAELEFSEGCQGIMMFCHRMVVETVGYLNIDWKGRYGYEHPVYSARIQKKFGLYPMYYARLMHCEDHFITQELPNAYEAKPEQNHKQYLDKMKDIGLGLGLVQRHSGIEHFYPVRYT